MSDDTPSLYEWAGGDQAFRRLLDAFYDRVEQDELISPYFPGGVHEKHRDHVAAWWREVFGEKLRGWGIEAEASPQVTRGTRHRNERVWKRKRPGASVRSVRRGANPGSPTRERSLRAWLEVGRALAASSDASDRKLSEAIVRFVREAPAMRELLNARAAQREQPGIARVAQPSPTRSRWATRSTATALPSSRPARPWPRSRPRCGPAGTRCS